MLFLYTKSWLARFPQFFFIRMVKTLLQVESLCMFLFCQLVNYYIKWVLNALLLKCLGKIPVENFISSCVFY